MGRVEHVLPHKRSPERANAPRNSVDFKRFGLEVTIYGVS